MGRGEADEKRPGVSSYSGKGFSLTVYVLENVSFGELASLSPNTLQHYGGREWRRTYSRDVLPQLLPREQLWGGKH